MTAPITIFLLLGAVALLAAASVKRIPEGHVYTLRRWRQPQPRLLLPGTHLIVPLMERIAHKISLAGHTLHLDATPDDSGLRGLVYWQVLDPERADAVIEDADALIRTHILQALSADAADTDTPRRNAQLKQSLNAQLRQQGMLVTRVDLHMA